MKATDRINILLEHFDITPYKFCKELEFSTGFLRGSRHIGTDKLAKILKYLDKANPLWIISGEGDMIKPSKEAVLTRSNSILSSKVDPIIDSQLIPLYKVDAIAGIVPVFQDFNEKEPIDYLSIPHAPKCDGAMYASGNSMYPLIKSGDILGYKEIKDIQNNIFWGHIYIIYIDVEGDLMRTVKYIQPSEDKGCVKLVSENKHHEPKEIHLDKIKAIAQVKITVRLG